MMKWKEKLFELNQKVETKNWYIHYRKDLLTKRITIEIKEDSNLFNRIKLINRIIVLIFKKTS